MNDKHQGFTGANTTQPSKRRVKQLAEEQASQGLGVDSNRVPVSDKNRTGPLDVLGPSAGSRLLKGTVVYALPFLNWYRVQLDGDAGTLGCCATDTGSMLPIGVKSATMMAPGTNVIVWHPPQSLNGVILGAWPSTPQDATQGVPDWVQQGGGSGFQRERAYTEPLRLFKGAAGIHNFMSNRPIDQTAIDWGYVTETGLAIHMDPFMAYMRVNEMCGVFMNYWDSYLRLAGMQVDIMTPGQDVVSRDDEGEISHYEGGTVYPWEAIGLFARGTDISEENNAKKVQLQELKTRFDEKDDEVGIQSFHRYREYGGYLGQGRMRMVVAPGRETGKQRYEDQPKDNPDFGMFREAIGLDGSYLLQSARQLIIGKRTLIPVPKQVKTPEDPTGDSKEDGNYKFSGVHGAGEEQKIGVVDTSEGGEDQGLLQIAALLDVMAYEHNWRPLHAFHYHVLDYAVPEESQYKKGPTRVMENLDFGQLSSKANMAYPEAKKIRIDDRYGEVDFFEREAGIAMLPDGGIVIFDGYGSELRMSGGHIDLTCPGDVKLLPGRQMVALSGNDFIIRALNSVDITAGKKDVRIKAEKNLHMLGGNSGSGGILLESKASSRRFEFDQKVGEDVNMNGIVMKCKGPVTTLAGEVYIRTGEGGLNNGNIVLDASRGGSAIEMHATAVNSFTSGKFEMFMGPKDTNSNTSTAYLFSPSAAFIGAQTQFKGQMLIDGSMLIDGGVQAQSFAGIQFPFVSRAKASTLQKSTRFVTKTWTDRRKAGQERHEGVFVNDLYTADQPGDNATIEKIEFSLRDVDDNSQYKTDSFKLAESRWMTMVRLNMATGGSEWTEPTVSYQGNQQLPWPGKKKWSDEETLLQLEELKLFDAAKGVDKDRTAGGSTEPAYEDPKISGSITATPASGYKIIN